MSAARNWPVSRAHRLATPALILTAALLGASGSQAQTPVQATLYIPDNWCQGGYCGSSPSVTLQSSMEQAFLDSRSVQVVRKAPNRGIQLTGGITAVNNGGSLCLPIVGCLSGKTLRATIELTEIGNGAVLWRDTCEGTSGGFTSWRWGGYLQINSDEDKAAADCAGKLAQKFMTSPTYLSYLTRLNTPAPLPVAQAGGTTSTATQSSGGNAPLAQGGGSGGPASPADPEVKTASSSWFYTLVFPDESTRQQACADGFASASKGVSASPPGQIKLNSTEATITISSSYNSIFLSCQEAGSKLKPKPDSVPQLDMYLVSELNGRVDEKILSAALAFYDQNNAEIGRFVLYSEDKAGGEGVTSTYSPGQLYNPCYGNNNNRTTCSVAITPDQLPSGIRNWISQASYVKLLANFGKGAESFNITKAKFPTVK